MPQLDILMFFSSQLSVSLFLTIMLLFCIIFVLYISYVSFITFSLYLNKFNNKKIEFSISNVFFNFNIISIASSTLPLFENNYRLGFQVPASADMATIMCTHNDIYYFLQVILVVVVWFLSYATFKNFRFVYPFHANMIYDPRFKADLMAQRFDSCTLLEIIWTIIPTAVLILIGYPSISLLYALDEHIKPDFLIKVIGHQWYWTYEYPSVRHKVTGMPLSYDSNLVEQPSMGKHFKDYHSISKKIRKKFDLTHPELDGEYITVDKPLFVPAHKRVQAIVTSSDVLHSWAIPNLGIKIDACPGRLNKISFQVDIDSRVYQFNLKSDMLRKLSYTKSPYTFGYWGQCSEFCGIGHGFMPIVLHAISSDSVYRYIDLLMSDQFSWGDGEGAHIFNKPWEKLKTSIFPHSEYKHPDTNKNAKLYGTVWLERYNRLDPEAKEKVCIKCGSDED